LNWLLRTFDCLSIWMINEGLDQQITSTDFWNRKYKTGHIYTVYLCHGRCIIFAVASDNFVPVFNSPEFKIDS
jgi:hypothetical protein